MQYELLFYYFYALISVSMLPFYFGTSEVRCWLFTNFSFLFYFRLKILIHYYFMSPEKLRFALIPVCLSINSTFDLDYKGRLICCFMTDLTPRAS